MPLEPNQMLLHYRLVEQIGEGGMGVVWKAEDTKLARQVAIKVLPGEFAEDTQRLARFEREAKLLATLNHPNVAAIYGFDTADGVHFLVLELVDGATLSEQLKTGALVLSEALDIGRQVAEGLGAAHAAGVIHRDLKPSNVIVTSNGNAKVLDFGLAKGVEGDRGMKPSDLSLSPTVTFGGTQAGVVLGTAPYMSPEQARGRLLDKRTDNWSFGCLLYECLTGTQAFGGETVTDTLSGILQNEPDWSALPRATPRRIRDLLERCLEKNPRDRLHDIGDARIDLERCLAAKEWTTSAMARATAGEPRRSGGLGRAVALTLGLALGALGYALLTGIGGPATGRPHRKFSLQTTGFTQVMQNISPDGRQIAYSADGRLWVRDLARLAPRELPEGEGASPLAWSLDGEWLAVADDRELSKIHVPGGNRTTLARLDVIAPLAGGAAWNSDGTITFCTGASGLLSVPAQGGNVTTLLEPGEGVQDYHQVASLGADRGVVYVVHRTGGMDSIAVLSGRTPKTVLQVPGATLSDPVYSATGHLIYSVGDFPAGALWAVPFDVNRLETTGDPFLVSEQGSQPSISADGTLLVHYAPDVGANTRIVRVDRSGTVIEVFDAPGIGHASPTFSPDGQRLAFSALVDGNIDLWVLEVASGTPQRLTFDPSAEGMPDWSPSGDRIAFSQARSGFANTLKILRGDGTGGIESVAEGAFLPSFSSDGKVLVFVKVNEALNPGLWYLDLQGDNEPVLFFDGTGLWEESPTVSPDGKLIAFSSDEQGGHQIYVRSFPSGDGKWQVSLDGGRTPAWSPRGDRLYFREGNDLMEVGVELEPTVRFGTPSRLFAWPFPAQTAFDFTSLFDVAPDGESFVLVEDTEPGVSRPGITVIENWIAEFGQ